jgi:phosphohistidine phosphatase SixA
MLISLLFQLAVAAPPPSAVVVVRHAERASSVDRDSPLSAEGMVRAASLDSLLRDAKVGAVIVTPFRRTAETAVQVVLRNNLTPMVVPVTGEVSAHAAQVAELAKSQGGVVLVVGHSNTVGAIVAALGGASDIGNLCERNHDQVFTVTFSKAGVHTMRGRYGREDPPDARSCG